MATGGMKLTSALEQAMTVTSSQSSQKFLSTRLRFPSRLTFFLWLAYYSADSRTLIRVPGLFTMPNFSTVSHSKKKVFRDVSLIEATAASQWKTACFCHCYCYVALSESFESIKTRHFIIFRQVIKFHFNVKHLRQHFWHHPNLFQIHR